MKRVAAAVLALGLSASLSGCLSVSKDTQSHGAQALCSSAGSSTASLRAGGDVARTVASLIYDNADDPQVKKVARAVSTNKSDKAGREYLARWLEDQCSR